MAREFDARKLADLVEQESKLTQEMQELNEQIENERQSDGWTGDKAGPKLVVYKKLVLDHEWKLRALQDVTKRRENCEDARPEQRPTQKNDSLRRFLLGGVELLDQDEKDAFVMEPTPEMIRDCPLVAANGHVFNMAATDPTRSDIDTGDSAAGLAAPQTWEEGLVERLKYFGAVARSCTNFSTDNGNTRHVNQMDSSAEEGGAMEDQSQDAAGIPGDAKPLPNVTDIEYTSYWRHSNFMDVRLEAFSDLQFNIAQRVQRDAMRRMGRGWNNAFTVGDGVKKPQGITTSATLVDGGTASILDAASGGLDYANLLDLEYGVDLGYLEPNEGGDGGFTDERSGMIGYMLNRNVEKALRTALDGDSRPLWSPNLETGRAIQGAPGMIQGKPYSINQHMADGKTTLDLPIMFGNFGHYGVRNVGGMMFYRFFDSSTIKSMSVRFIAMSRRDGRSLGPIVGAKCEAYVALQVKT